MGAPRWVRHATLALATAGGIGRLPWVPGTWGSTVGLGLGVLLARDVGAPLAWLVLCLSFLGAVPLCAQAERAWGRRDPPEVVLDEVWGMTAVVILLPQTVRSGPWLLLAFLLFRVMDILKPPPLRRLGRLPAGWGIMADDLGAALYTIAGVWIGLLVRRGVIGW